MPANASALHLRTADMLDECANELGDGTAGGDDIADRARAFAASLRASATARDAVSEAERYILDCARAYAIAFDATCDDESREDDAVRAGRERYRLLCAALHPRFRDALRTAREVKP